MSKETSEWLNANTLIGFTEQRAAKGAPNEGRAWHYRASDQGDEPNHYPGAIPVEDVRRRLFNWQALKVNTYFEWEGGKITALGSEGTTNLAQSMRKTIIRSDTGAELGAFKDGYQPHQYGEWLIHNVANILDDDLKIGSAGLLKGGAVAWCEVTVPETITTPEGLAFRPNLLAASSFNGSLATTFKPTVQATVCDNTLTLALAERGPQVKIKSTKNSLTRIGDVREALQIVHTIGDDFAAQVATLCSTKLSDHQYEDLIDLVQPMPNPGDAKTTRAITLAEGKRDTLWRLWRNDERVAPWRGTAFGAWQALNTYNHHEANVRGMSRPERNMLNAINGTTEQSDASDLEMILSLAA